MPNPEISQIRIPNPRASEQGQPATLTYDIKDTVARAAITAGLTFHIATEASNTPYGVTWDNHGTLVTGTLVASATTTGFYLVPCGHTQTRDAYAEYVAVLISESPATYSWEKIGDTELDFDNLAQYLDTTVTKPTDSVLGADTTFQTPSMTVSFSGGSTENFITAISPTTNKLETATIKGVGTDITFNAVSADPGTVTATNTVFGTDTTASKIVTESKTATSVTFDNDTTASHVASSTSKAIPQRATSATNISRIGTNNSVTSILQSATVAEGSEVLVFGDVAVSHASVTGVQAAANDVNVTDYTFENITVPVISAHSDVTVASVKTNTDVTVPVVSSNAAVTASGQITLASKTAATSAANATTVATGSLNSDDAVGATIATGLGTPTKVAGVTNVGTATTPATNVTVGSNDLVNAVTDVTVTIIDKASS